MTQEESQNPPPTEPLSEDEKRMAFFAHIEELRVRVMRMLWVFVMGFIGGYYSSEPVMRWLKQPLFKVLPPDKQALYFTGLFENFMTHLKVAACISIFALSPYFFFEIWGFVAPGLKRHEKKLVIPFVTAATFFFIVGGLFAYYVLFPVGFKFFVTYGGPTDIPLLTIDSYYSTCMKLMLLFGLGFELPVFVCLMGAIGLVDAPMLRKQRKFAIIGITVLSAMFAPPDAMSMLLLMVPLVLLYEASILVVATMGARRKASTKDVAPVDPLRGKSDY